MADERSSSEALKKRLSEEVCYEDLKVSFDMRECTFQPNAHRATSRKARPLKTSLDLHHDAQVRRNGLRERIIINEQKKHLEEVSECTFQPQVNRTDDDSSNTDRCLKLFQDSQRKVMRASPPSRLLVQGGVANQKERTQPQSVTAYLKSLSVEEVSKEDAFSHDPHHLLEHVNRIRAVRDATPLPEEFDPPFIVPSPMLFTRDSGYKTLGPWRDASVTMARKQKRHRGFAAFAFTPHTRRGGAGDVFSARGNWLSQQVTRG